jgi:hypothetical protein
MCSGCQQLKKEVLEEGDRTLGEDGRQAILQTLQGI